jgi:clan AA aspartic protease (TIGR02281 family)
VQSKPFTSENNPPNRNPVYMFISTRPAERVVNEFWLMIGYRFKTGSEATAQIGGSTFRLLTHQDAAWAKSLDEQAKMLRAMRDADSVVIKGVSAKGTQSIDTFTLQGFGEAVDRAYQECIATEPQESATDNGQQSDKFIVQLKDDRGVFVVPVEINSAITLDFVIDSGASDVSVPADVVSVLIRNHTIEKSDFVGKQTYKMADGSEAPSAVFTIRSLKIGDHRIENVTGSIAPAKGELLLGQSFLQKFRSWSIDNTKHVLVLE